MLDFADFIDLIYSIHDRKLLENFLVGVTTEREREEFAGRVEIVKRLVAGEPQAKIASDLGVGVATITRGSKELARGNFAVLRGDSGTASRESRLYRYNDWLYRAGEAIATDCNTT